MNFKSYSLPSNHRINNEQEDNFNETSSSAWIKNPKKYTHYKKPKKSKTTRISAKMNATMRIPKSTDSLNDTEKEDEKKDFELVGSNPRDIPFWNNRRNVNR